MKKRIVAIVSVLAIVLLYSFNVFATSSTGKTITSTSTSYNNGDVTLYTRVNGKYSYNEPGNNAYGVYYYEHNFTVTLANNTNEFQVADTNTFTIDLYTGYTDTFSTSGTRPSWGNYVTSYSSNMSIPRVIQHNSGDLSGHVLITFQDSDLLVLNPNETREYNFSIMFTQDYDSVQQSVINGDVIISYFTYTGTVSNYAKPSTFTSQTIENFIQNDSLPNSVIAYFQYLLEQGTTEQTTLDNIYSYMIQHYPYQSSTLTNQQYRYQNNTINYDISDGNSTIGRIYSEVSTYAPYLVTSDHNIFTYNGTNVNYEEQSIICVPIRYHIRIRCFNNNSYNLSQTYIDYRGVPSFSIDSGYYASSDIEILEDEGLIFQSFSNTGIIIGFENYYNGNPVLYGSDYIYITFMEYRYYVVDRIYDTTNIVNIRHGINGYTFPSSGVFYNTIIATNNNLGWWGNTKNVLNSIKDKLQEILNGYNTNQPVASDVTSETGDIADTVDDQHDTEANYFNDTNSYIDDTNIDNFQFNSETSSGIGGVKNDFMAVWNACGSLNSIWILSLTLGLALHIIRHRRMFE